MNESDETQPIPTTQPESAQPESAQRETTGIWRRKSTAVAGGALGVAVLLIGGFALGGAFGDDDDDARPAAAQTQTQQADDTSDTNDDVTSEAPAGVSVGAKDADALIAVLSAARDEAKGTVTSMEAGRDGSWSVDLENARGDETTVRVEDDGTASVVRTEAADADDANDPAPAGTLSDTNMAALVDAAFGEATGLIVDIDLDDEPNEAYSVQVRASDGTETEIDLDTDFSVTKSEVDRD